MSAPRLELQPISFAECCTFVRQFHAHHPPNQGWKFGIAVNDGQRVVGVVVVGRPVARHLDTGWTLEVTRCCTDRTRHVASMLYAAAWRATKALGYKRLVTYTLASEAGTSLKAAGYRQLYSTPDRAKGWNMPSRPRQVKAPTESKTLWEMTA